MKRLILLCAILMAAMQTPAQGGTPADSLRARQILQQLTLEEKVGLMLYDSPPIPRLGIRHYNWWNEALHGVARNGNATVFPMPIAMASSFDPSLLQEVFTVVSDEGRVKMRLAEAEMEKTPWPAYNMWYKGVTFWTPNINIFRDPRWGRGMETYGEDPYLTGVMGTAVVKGLQGPEDAPQQKAHACAKHFAVHSGPESNRHSFNAEVSERDFRETYLPAFKELVTKGKVKEVMFAYNRLYGEPCGANTRLLQDILRGEWRYDGIILSDCWAVSDFYKKGYHGFVSTAAEAAAAAVKAGANLECGNEFKHLPEAVAQGLLTEKDLDDSVFRLLLARIELGELDGKSCWDALPENLLCGPKHAELALKMARESIVLLSNKDRALPLQKNEKIALVGPNAADSIMLRGNYEGIPLRTVTLKDALAARIPDLKYLPGCKHALDTLTEERKNSLLQELEEYPTVLFAGGISPRLEGEEMPVKVPGFKGGDRTSIELPAVQRELVKALADAGKKVIFINFSGSAIGLAPEQERCAALIQAWYLGQEAGTALAEVLYGETNPSGKLPVTFYAADSQLPDFEDYRMKGHTYRFFEGRPLFPFGHGLSYTTFRYGRARIRRGEDGKKYLCINIKNTGEVDGTETVQLYVKKAGKDPDGPSKTLRGFARVTISAGQSAVARIPLPPETFNWWNDRTQQVEPLPGRYRLLYGGSSADKGLKSKGYRFRTASKG